MHTLALPGFMGQALRFPPVSVEPREPIPYDLRPPWTATSWWGY